MVGVAVGMSSGCSGADEKVRGDDVVFLMKVKTRSRESELEVLAWGLFVHVTAFYA
jgi:hypothetical protein